MKLNTSHLIVVSSLALASVSTPLTGQAGQSASTGISRVQFARPASQQTAHHSDGKIIEFDAPRATTVVSAACGGSCGTSALANNAFGTIVGYYTDKYVVPHGFIRNCAGRFLSFDAPGAGLGHGLNEGTVAYAIDDAGEISGQYQDTSLNFHGFVREPNGRFEVFDAPGISTKPGFATLPWSIDRHGNTAGIYYDGSNVYHGFVRSRDRHIATFDPPGSVSTFVCQQTCLSDVGAVGGFTDKNGVLHGFVRKPNGKILEYDAPGAGRGAGQGTTFQSVNVQGTIAGVVIDANNVFHAFLRYPNGSYRIGQVPGAGTGPHQGTIPEAINAFDAVALEAFFPDNTLHSFEYFPNGALLRVDAPDATVVTRVSTVNLRGEIAGYYIDRNDLNHGFLFLP